MADGTSYPDNVRLCASARGTCVLAAPSVVAEIWPYRIYADELTIVGSMAILRSFPAAIDTIGRHADRLAPLVTDRFALEHVDAALQTVADGRSVKTVLTP